MKSTLSHQSTRYTMLMDKISKDKMFDSYHERKSTSIDREPMEDDDSSINSDEDGNDEKYDWMNNPFTIIDENANLEEVLHAKTIGEAMQILCPNIPGLPTKSRGKYKKRKLLTNEEKSEVLRATNRENARLTRKRKKIYHDVISSILIKLHQDLGSDTVRKYVNIVNDGTSKQYLEQHLVRADNPTPSSISDINTSMITFNDHDHHQSHNEVRLPSMNSFHSSITSSGTSPLPQHILSNQSHNHHNNISYPAASSSSSSPTMVDVISSRQRFDTVLSYLNLRVATCSSTYDHSNNMITDMMEKLRWPVSSPSSEDWHMICDDHIMHLMPLPVFRDMSDKALMKPGGYECHGIPALVDDIKCIRSFCQWVVSQRYQENDNIIWHLVHDVDHASVLINPVADKICFDYHLILYVAILPPSSSSLSSSSPPSSSPSSSASSSEPMSKRTRNKKDIHAPSFPSSSVSSTLSVSSLSSSSVSSSISSLSSSSSSSISSSVLPEVVKVMDIPVILTADFHPASGKIMHVSEHYDVMQILFEKEQLKHLTAMQHRINMNHHHTASSSSY